MAHFDAPTPLLPEILALHSKWRGDLPALICQQQTLSWREFGQHINQFAHTLLATAQPPGSRVGVIMENSVEMAVALFGTMAAGFTSVPINLSVSDQALQQLLEDAEVSVVVASDSQRQRLTTTVHARRDQIRLCITTGQAVDGWQNFQQLLHIAPSHCPEITIDPEQVVNIIYSSGTTGLPKGIQATQRGRRDWAYDLAIALRYHAGSRTLITIGMYSNITWVAMLSTLVSGGTLVIERQFDADQFLTAVETLHITHTAMVPVQFQRVIERQRERGADLSSMQAMMSCGSPLHAELKKALFEQFSCGVIELYGLTEGVITTLDPEHAQGRWSSVGKPLIGTDIQIIGDNDQPLGCGESGEIVSRGRITMPGYHNRADADVEASWYDSAGKVWLRTGDIGYLDSEGYLYIVDRKKDMILSGGQNIYPQDIEAIIFTHPAVDDVAVIGLKSATWGETPVALVVAKQPLEASDLQQWCNQQLGKQQRIAEVIFVESLPRNPNGKILKRELRQQFSDRQY